VIVGGTAIDVVRERATSLVADARVDVSLAATAHRLGAPSPPPTLCGSLTTTEATAVFPS